MSYGPFSVVRTLRGDERHEAVQVELDDQAWELKVPTGRRGAGEGESFLDRAGRMLEVRHPSLRRVRRAGRLADGRPYVLVDAVAGPTLEEAGPLTLRESLELGLQVSGALSALHRAGVLTGPLRATDIIRATPALLDGSLAGLSPAGSVELDTQSLVKVLLSAGLRRGADARLRAELEAVASAEELEAMLRSMLELFRSTLAPGATVEVLEPDLSGNQVGPWRLDRVIGEGAIGRVYVAHHRERPGSAAVKVLKREHAADVEVRRRFVLEAKALDAVRDEHLVKMYELGEVPHPDGPVVYCAMELLEGEPLSTTLSRGPLDVARAAGIAQQVARALHAAHQLGVIHRDVKPENVFLHRPAGAAEQVKVLDFGLAKLLRPIGGLVPPGTHAGTVVGTPEYMAPEQAIGMEVDLRADLFAVGLLLYELLTGKSPYPANTFARHIVALTHTTAPRLPAVTPRGEVIPEGLADLVARCLERERGRRFETGAELDLALEPFAQAGLATRRERRRGALLVALGLGALAAGVVGGLGVRQMARARAREQDQVEAMAMAIGRAVPRVTLRVESEPSGARVVREDSGEVLGTTPLALPIAATARLDLRLSLEGYAEERRALSLASDASLKVGLKRSPADRRRKAKAP